MLPVAPVVMIALPLVYGLYVPPPSMLNWYSSDAPVEPPEPALPVTVPVLNPAQTVEPFTGVAVFRVGAVGVPPKVHVHMVLQALLLHP